MEKRGIKLVLFLLIFLLIPVSFAQTGCCIDLDSTPICIGNIEQSSCSGQWLVDSCPSSCDEQCLVCESDGELILRWLAPLAECPPPEQINTSLPLLSESECEGIFTGTIQSMGTIRGLVKDEETGAIVSNAFVECTGVVAKSTSTGYSLDGCSPETKKISAYYLNKSGEYLLTSTQINSLVSGYEVSGIDVEISSTPTTSITINVVDTATNVAIITANNPIIKVTDSDGNVQQKSGSTATFNVKPGNILIEVSASGYSSFSGTFNTAYTPFKISLVKIVTVPLTGTIFDGARPGQSLPDASVQLLNNLGKVVTSTTSGSTGSYSLQAPLGTYSLIVSKSSYQQYTKSFTFEKDKSYTQDVTLIPTVPEISIRTINFLVRIQGTTTGVPAASVQIYPGELNFYTSSIGRIDGLNLADGSYAVIIIHPDYKPFFGQITVSKDETMVLYLIPITQIQISGRVLDNNGNVLSGAKFSLLGQSTYTSVVGTFSVQVKAPEFNVNAYVSKDGYITQTVDIPGGLTNDYAIPTDIKLTPLLCNDINNLGTVSLTVTQQPGEASLQWTSACKPAQFIVKKGTKVIYAVDNPTLNSGTFIDENLVPEQLNCYSIEAIFNINGILKTIISQNSPICIPAGPEECFDGDKEFCDENTLMKCLNGIFVPTTGTPCETSNEICIEESPTTATCVEQDPCNKCNRPFGLFSTSQGSIFFGGKIYEKLTFSALFCQEAPSCYLDLSRTIVDKYYSCGEIDSCYDYNSRDACEASKCTQNCEWIDSSYSELGIGVCRPEIEEEQECTKFNTRIMTEPASKVFASTKGLVGKELCSLYREVDGESACYFKSTTGSCMDKEDVSCYDYEDKIDCIGETEQEVNVDLMWGVANNFYFKTAGSNEILVKSSDLFNQGICKFRVGCVRDANDNEDLLVTQFSSFSYTDPKADCLNLGGVYDSRCALDITPPVTNIIEKQYVPALINLNYTVVDVQDKLYIKTRFIAVEKEFFNNDYPTKLAINNKITTPLLDGEYVLSYFSEDSSKNLEEVRTLDIIVDGTPPVITFTKSVIPDTANNKVTFIPVLTSNEPVRCIRDSPNTGLYTPNAVISVESSLGNEFRTEFSETYIVPTTSPVTSTYKWKCIDRAGNVVQDSRTTTLSANMIISDPMPDIAIRRTEIADVSINAMFDGECRYIDSTEAYKSFSLWTPLPVKSEAYTFSGTIPISATDYNKRFRVACNFTGFKTIIYGGKEDDIKLTIDDLAPNTLLFKDNAEEAIIPGSQTIWANGNNLLLKCVDVDQGIDDFPEESGCKNLYHCVAAKNEQCTPNIESNLQVRPELTETSTIWFYSVDNYDNTEESIRAQTVLFDNTPPEIILEKPSSNEITESKIDSIDIKGIISNTGEGDVSALDTDNTYYELLVGEEVKIKENIYLSDPSKIGNISISRSNIILRPNVVNTIQIITKDIAGNERSIGVTVVHDSEGPLIQNAQILQRKGDVTTNSLQIEYGENLVLEIQNLLDAYPLGNSAERIKKVTAKDIFGAVYSFEKLGAVWRGAIITRTWPVIKSNLTIITEDVLGNKAERQVTFEVIDSMDPSAFIRIENPYGESISSFIDGENHVVLEATEPLNDSKLSVKILDIEYPVEFTLRDVDAMIWVGKVNIPEGLFASEVSMEGIMHDANGRDSTAFYPTITSLSANSIEFPQPIPNNALSTGEDSFETTLIPVRYFLPDGYSYQFTVNNIVTQVQGGTTADIQGLTDGNNLINIRIENLERNYKTFTQTINFIPEIPTVQTESTGTITINTENLYYPGAVTIDGKKVTNMHSIKIFGSYDAAEEISEIYIIGADGKKYSASMNDGVFEADVSLIGRTFTTTENALTIVFVNSNGNIRKEIVSIEKDLKPPQLIYLLFTRLR